LDVIELIENFGFAPGSNRQGKVRKVGRTF
jgi:hypothetical protein